MSDLLYIGKMLTAISGIMGILWGVIKLIWGVSFTSRANLIQGNVGGVVPLFFGIALLVCYYFLEEKIIKQYIVGILITLFAFISGCYLGLIAGPLILLDSYISNKNISIHIDNQNEQIT